MRQITIKFLTLAILACVMFAAKIVYAGPGFRYKTSHGMSACEFAVPPTPGASINGGVVSSGNRAVTVAGQIGSNVTLRLICKREQTYSDTGDLVSIGPEVGYNGPGTATVVGVDKPGDSSSGFEIAKGREWTVEVAASPATYTLTGGSDSIAVTVQPLDAPVTPQQLAPISDTANQALASSTYDYKRRIMAMYASYILHVDSFEGPNKYGVKPDARQGFGFDYDVTIPASDSQVKFLTGVTFDMMFRQKEVAYAPNAPTNGYNSYVDWKTIFIGPKAGVDWMPAEWFRFNVWGSLGLLASIDGTIPISQLPDRTLYNGESDTQAAFGYKAVLAAHFVLGKHFLFGPAIGLQGNITELPLQRGPERICSATDGSCLVQRKGHFLDVPMFISAGGQF